MQVFLIGTPFETAASLDFKRRNRQISECKLIIKAIENPYTGWFRMPVTKMYSGNLAFLKHYQNTLELYKNGLIKEAENESKLAMMHKPEFYTDAFLNHMKRRLYTKDPVFYQQWSTLGKSDINVYYVNGCWCAFRNNKKINSFTFE